jgi:predicted DNA binding protein
VLTVRLLIDYQENWIRSIARDSARVKIIDVKAPRPGFTQNFVELASENTTPEELLSRVQKYPGVLKSDLSKVGKNRVMGTITTRGCPVCSTFAGVDCFRVSASTREGGRMEWTVSMSGDSRFNALCKRLERRKVRYSILEMSHHMQKKQITSRQEDLVRMAFGLGYFEFPKRIDLEKLSTKLGISIGTLSEILRRGEKHIISRYFDSPSP